VTPKFVREKKKKGKLDGKEEEGKTCFVAFQSGTEGNTSTEKGDEAHRGIRQNGACERDGRESEEDCTQGGDTVMKIGENRALQIPKEEGGSGSVGQNQRHGLVQWKV